MKAAFAFSAAKPIVPGLPEKFCHNVHAEPNPTDPQRPAILLETPGSLRRNTFAFACRGMWQADGHAGGKALIGQGTTLSTFSPVDNTVSSLTGSIAGTDRGDCAFTEQQAMFLFNGQPYVSDGTYIRRASDGVTVDPNLAIGSTPANVATGAFSYSIDGTIYNKTAVAAGTAPGNDVVPLGLYGAVALDIDAAGTITAIEAPLNATGYATASDASNALPTVLTTRVRIGYVTASKSDGAFTFGTTSLAAANTTVAYTDSAVNTGFTDLLTDHGQTVFTSVAAVGQRFLLTYGSRFCFTDVLDGFSTDVLSYYTAESSPDALIAGRVVSNVYYLFGTKTIEPWVQSGDSTDPFAVQEGLIQQVGAICRDGIISADNTLFFIDDGYSPRRLGAGASQIINLKDPWVTDLLKSAGATSILGRTYQDRAHTFVMWRTPSGCPVYDGMTEQWHTRGTLNTDTWRYTDMVEGFARVFVCDATGQFDELSRDYLSESMTNTTTMGTEIQRILTAVLPTDRARMDVSTVNMDCAKGVGLVSGQGSDPVIEMRYSTDNGNTWSAWRSRSLGVMGAYSQNTIWRRCGRTRNQGMIFQFRKSDPVRTAYLGVAINEDITT